MKPLLCLIFLCFLTANVSAQNVSGKWYGKINQQPGGYSDLYDFELNLDQGNRISGDSYAYIKDILHVRIGLSGYIDKDTIRLSENKNWIWQEKLPWSWVLCIKNLNLLYRKQYGTEFLEGTWDGVSKEDSRDPCIPGRIVLARNKDALNLFFKETGDSVIALEPLNYVNDIPPDFTSLFRNTEPEKATEIIVKHPELQLKIRDYLKVDNDTVSVYLNRSPLEKNIKVSKRAITINFQIDPGISLHEILLFAENLGKIPPNTSQLLIIDGKSTHKVMIVSDKQKTAAVYLRYNPN